MKKLYKFIKSQTLYFGNLVNWLIMLIMRENLRCYIKDDMKNKELRIVCNGPSLNIDEAFTKDINTEYCMVNHACQTPEFKRIKPSIYIIADPAFFYKNCSENISKSWSCINEVDWNMTIFVPFYVYKEAKEIAINSNLKICCYHSAPLNSWRKFTFAMYNRNLAMPFAGNVMIASIYVGILKGFSKIRLYGSDHSWTEQLRVNENNEVCIKQIHYYDTNEVKLVPWNDETGKPFSMRIILKRFSDIFEQYEILEQYAKSKGVSILNMCPESYIDAFKKI